MFLAVNYILCSLPVEKLRKHPKDMLDSKMSKGPTRSMGTKGSKRPKGFTRPEGSKGFIRSYTSSSHKKCSQNSVNKDNKRVAI